MNEFKSWHRAEFGEDKELDDLEKSSEISERERFSKYWDNVVKKLARGFDEDQIDFDRDYRFLSARRVDDSKDLKKKKDEETEEKRDSKVGNSTFKESNPKDTNVSEVVSIEPASNEVISQAINSVVNVLEDTNVYPKVDIQEYIKQGLETGTLLPFTAEKFARIIARPGMIGEEVISWSEDKNDNEVKEKVATVKLDEKTNQPGWVVAKADENGVAVIDKNGHPNQWIIEDSIFRQKYEVDPVYPWLFKPTGGVQTFVELSQGITLEQWGEVMAIDAGGFINITNANDMYGISKRDFEDTYRVVQPPERPKSL